MYTKGWGFAVGRICAEQRPIIAALKRAGIGRPAMHDERDRGEGIRQKFVRVHGIEFEGSLRLEHREGGNKPLHVKETQPGVYLSSWMIDAKYCRQFMREVKNSGRHVVLSLVVDTNVPGHPSVSMQLQEIFVT